LKRWKLKQRAVAQLAKRSLLTPEDLGWNTATINFYVAIIHCYTEMKTMKKIKKKRPEMADFFKKYENCSNEWPMSDK